MLYFNVDRFWTFERGTAITPINAHNFNCPPALADKVLITRIEVSFSFCMHLKRKVRIVIRVKRIVEIGFRLIGIFRFILSFLCIY